MLLTVAGLLLFAAGALGTDAAVPPRPAAVVILRDGTRYNLSKPYEIRGTQARLPLTNGTLVSVRASEIDTVATARAVEAAERPSASPTPAPTARVSLTDASLVPAGKGNFSAARSSVSAGTVESPAAGPKKPGSPRTEPTPTSSDEDQWRSRAEKARAALSKAEADLAQADKDMTVVTFGKPDATHEIRMSQREAALLPYRQRVREAAAALAVIPEECRTTAGCQPGWIR